jgi:hypothetical protein
MPAANKTKCKRDHGDNYVVPLELKWMEIENRSILASAYVMYTKVHSDKIISLI